MVPGTQQRKWWEAASFQKYLEGRESSMTLRVTFPILQVRKLKAE